MQIRQPLMFLVLIVFSLQAKGQEPEPISRALPRNIKVTRDLVYAKYGSRSLRLDLYEPDNQSAALLPSIVVIRDGGWRSGDKEGFGPMAAALASRGLVAVSIEYRTQEEAKFPAAVQDAKAAVRWLRANAGKYRLDPDAIGALGGSAGAHLAVYMGVTNGLTKLEGTGGNQDCSSFVSAVVGLATPANLPSFGGLDEGTTPLVAFLGKSYKEDPILWTFASPISQVTKSSPPLLLIHSGLDQIVPFGHSLEMAERYGQAGSPVEVILIPDAPHTFWWFKKWFGTTMDRSASFFRMHLRQAK